MLRVGKEWYIGRNIRVSYLPSLLHFPGKANVVNFSRHVLLGTGTWYIAYSSSDIFLSFTDLCWKNESSVPFNVRVLVVVLF